VKGKGLPRQPKPPAPHLQPVSDTPFPLDIPAEAKVIVMAQRELTGVAWKQLQAEIDYCKPRTDKLLEGGEEFHLTDPNLRVWIDDDLKQKLNAAITLHQGVVEVRFFGPDQTLNECFFAACAKLGLSPRYAIGRRSKPFATSVLFKLRDDEAKRLDDEYSTFKPKPFSLDDARRGVVISYAPPAKKGSNAHKVTTLMPGSLLWHENGVDYDLIVWRLETGQGDATRWRTAPTPVEFFQIVRAAAYAAILNIVTAKAWRSYPERRSFCEWLARVVRDGQAINANIVFAKASRAIIADPNHAKALIELIAESKVLPETREDSVAMFEFARKRLEADPGRQDVAGWSIIKERFGDEAYKALRSVLNVGADSTLLEDFADRYLFHSGEGQFVDCQAFREGQAQFIFSKDSLALRHAPDQIQTKKKPVKAFPIFIESKMRQDITDVETYPDHPPGSIIRVTREGATIPDNDYAPEHSRLIFNEWRGLYVKPAKTIERALEAECVDKLDHMLSLVARTKPRADWIKAHFGWTLKYPGRKQQVALVCTGDQGTGKSFLCQTFAQAVFGGYAGAASVRALNGQFYIAGYIGKLWVSHDEFVSNFDNAEILKTLIRGTRVAGELKGRDSANFTIYARLAFTSNEANPGISRGRDDRGLFQVTSISASGEGLLPNEFQAKVRQEIDPFYADYATFLERDDVRQAYVRILMDHAPSKMSDVVDLTHSAVRDSTVARAHLTDRQIVAKTILESGVIHSGYDIAMPFQDPDLYQRVSNVVKELGIRRVAAEEVLSEWIAASLIERPGPGEPYLFKFKLGALQRIYGDYLGVPLHSQWRLEPNDDMPNDWRQGDPLEPWKGRAKNEEEKGQYETRRY
jgi:hypothetical protein